VSLTLLNSSIVVLAEAHNTTILHPEFLKNQKIVPSDWSPVEGALCTPALSVVKYPRVALTADTGKFQIIEPTDKPEGLMIADIAAKYIEALPHVHYTAIGINFVGYIKTPAPTDWLESRFFRVGDKQSRGEVAGAKFTYDEQHATLTWDVGTVQQPTSDPSPCILVNSNYNFNLRRDSAVEDAKGVLARFSECMNHFNSVVSKVEAVAK
jgi:hypothetical protein